MKMYAGLDVALTELYRLYDFYNKEFYENNLPLPQITIQKADSRNILGWATVGQVWRTVQGDGRYEINIVAESLSRPVVEIACTLLHEVVHIANSVKKITDCTSHQYHNNHFKAEAERVGLHVERLQNYGYAKTSPTEKLISLLGKEPLKENAFQYYRVIAKKQGPGPRGGNSKMKKYSCGCTNVRCAVELKATCDKCGSEFKLQE